MSDGPGHRRRETDRYGRLAWVVGSLAATIGAVALALATGTPPRASAWWLVGGGAVAIFLASALSGPYGPGLIHDVTERIAALGRHASSASSKIILSFLLTSIVMLSIGLVATKWMGAERPAAGRCDFPDPLPVLTSPAGFGPYSQVAEAYERSTAEGHDGCRTVDMLVFELPPAKAQGGMIAGWSGDYRRQWPRPAVWLPDSTHEITQVERVLGRRITRGAPVARSPIVLGVPQSVAAKLGDDRNADGSTWARLFTSATDLGLEVVRPDPDTSILGEFARAALYESMGALEDPSRIRAIERDIARASDIGGYTVDETGAVRCRELSNRTSRTAAITSEQALARFNQSDRLGEACRGGDTRPGETLIAYYPRDTPGLDHPFARLNWENVTSNNATPQPDPQVAAAERFGRWLTSSEGQCALRTAELGPADPGAVHGCPSEDPLTSENGVTAGAIVDVTPPTPVVLKQAKEGYEEARRRGRMLLAVDASGSMTNTVRGEQVTRFQVTVKGIRELLGRMSPSDEFGLWLFPNEAAGSQPRLGTGPRDGPVGKLPRRKVAEDTLNGVKPRGNTPLYPTILDGLRALGPSNDETVTGLVVLTDGNDTSGLTSEEFLQRVPEGAVRVYVIAVGEAYCGGALTELVDKTEGDCRSVDVGTVGDELGKVFSGLWGGGK